MIQRPRCDVCGNDEQLTADEHDRLVIVACEQCRAAGKRPTVARRVVRFIPHPVAG